MSLEGVEFVDDIKQAIKLITPQLAAYSASQLTIKARKIGYENGAVFLPPMNFALTYATMVLPSASHNHIVPK